MSFPSLSVILAQDAPPAAPVAQPGMGGMLVPMILMFVIFYFILIRPQRKQQKELEAKRNALQIGDDVITIGGIHGRVTNKTDRTVTVKVADNTKIKFEKSAISQVFPSGKEKPADSEPETPESESTSA
ncbi:MAG: preprotein translocase subunit YajC [Verrucomicrobiales bacterium]|nr:preprotein translocase subunit YajC [Verrucomicrobiales bacterium]